MQPLAAVREYPPPFEASHLPDGFKPKLRKDAGLFKGAEELYPSGLAGDCRGPRETTHANFPWVVDRRTCNHARARGGWPQSGYTKTCLASSAPSKFAPTQQTSPESGVPVGVIGVVFNNHSIIDTEFVVKGSNGFQTESTEPVPPGGAAGMTFPDGPPWPPGTQCWAIATAFGYEAGDNFTIPGAPVPDWTITYTLTGGPGTERFSCSACGGPGT